MPFSSTNEFGKISPSSLKILSGSLGSIRFSLRFHSSVNFALTTISTFPVFLTVTFLLISTPGAHLSVGINSSSIVVSYFAVLSLFSTVKSLEK